MNTEQISTAIAADHPYAGHVCLHSNPLIEHCQQCYDAAPGLWHAKAARGTSLQATEGSCDVCDMRWTGYGTRCPVCEGERVVLDTAGEPSIPKQEIRRAVRAVVKRRGEIGMVKSPAYCSHCCVICRADTTGVLADRCYMCGGPMVHVPDNSPPGHTDLMVSPESIDDYD